MDKPTHGNLYGRLRAVWRRERLLRLAEGALAFLRWLLSLFLVCGLVDWLCCKWPGELPAAVRYGMLVLLAGASFYKGWVAGWKRVRSFDPVRTALQIEGQHGGMESLLVTALQLQDGTRRHGTSAALCALTCRRAEAFADAIRPDATMRLGALRRPAGAALGVVLLLGILAATHGPLLTAAVGRILAPWRAVSYPTRTQLELLSGDIVVQEGKPVTIGARIRGVVPRKARIALRTGDGKARMRSIPVVNGACAYNIETAFRGFDYRLTAGDAHSAWRKVEVISAPNITRADVTLVFPEYTRRTAETVDALTVSVPEATRVHWKLSLDQAVCQATLNLSGQPPQPMEISGDGRTVAITQVAGGSGAYGFSWVERDHGFAFTSPNHYLQVEPDRAPQVELTSPDRTLYATIGRKLDLVFRGRDDHGVEESIIAYSVDKTAEERVPFTPAKPVDGTEQRVDWDYRAVLTNLMVGQAVTFVIELADGYPGENGPHRARSEARRIQFMTQADYLAQVEKQRRRLLGQLKTVYKEEREVHEVVLRLDRADPVFVQTCQLEAVRQDLLRDRLQKLATNMGALADDLAANGITNLPLTASLRDLGSDMRVVADEHVAGAAESLRSLAGEAGRQQTDGGVRAQAEDRVNGAARELGLLVLQLGFEDASDVMAREMHAAAETQAALRRWTTMAAGDDLAGAQERLGKWLSRLFAATPKGMESSAGDALVEFTLTRMVKQLIKAGVGAQLEEAARLIRADRRSDAARIQSAATAALLSAEFRLRVGAEREALAKATALLLSQQEAQRQFGLELANLDEQTIKQKRTELVRVQASLHRNQQLLLIPAIPAPRARLLDDALPSAPPVADLLVTADEAMTQAVRQIGEGDRAGAVKAQHVAESTFAELAGLARQRMVAMTQAARIERLTYGAQETDERLGRFLERQTGLLERTEDAVAEKTRSEYLAEQEEALAAAVDEVLTELAERKKSAGTPFEESESLAARLGEARQVMRKSVPFLRENRPGEAIPQQNAAAAALIGARALLAEHGSNITAYAALVAGTKLAMMPGPYVAEIGEEQRDMLTLTRATDKDHLPSLAIPQKNLVHAVDAVLTALDPISHLVKSGTVMLFAKEDMDAAGAALAAKDPVEAVDAQEYIVETLETLGRQIDAVVPQYRYLLEIAEALHETVPEGVAIREAQRALRGRTAANEGLPAKEQAVLRTKAEAYRQLVQKVTGCGFVTDVVQAMVAAEDRLARGDSKAAVDRMAQAEQALDAEVATLLLLMKRLAAVLQAPPPETAIPEEFALLREVVGLAAKQKDLYRAWAMANAERAGREAELRELEKACSPYVERARTHKNPIPKGAAEPVEPLPPANLQRHLVSAQGCLAQAAVSAGAGDRRVALEQQKEASVHLRHFVVEYALKFYMEAPGSGPGDPVPTTDFVEGEDLLMLFMPGAVSGTRPPDGKLDWEVLGRRDRAALNENFARELPLEYRTMLKDYYERLSQ